MISSFNTDVDTFTSSQQVVYFVQDTYLRTVTVKLKGNAENSSVYMQVTSPYMAQSITTPTVEIGEGDKTVEFTVNAHITALNDSRTFYLNLYLRGTNFSVYGGAVSNDDKLFFQGTMAYHSPDYRSKIWNSRYDVTSDEVCFISGDNTPRLINNSGEDWNDWARDSEGYPLNINIPRIKADINDGLPFFFLMGGAIYKIISNYKNLLCQQKI